MQQELDKINSHIRYQNHSNSSSKESIVAESDFCYSAENNLDEKLKEAVVKFKNKSLGELKKSTKAKDTSTLFELLTNQPNELF